MNNKSSLKYLKWVVFASLGFYNPMGLIDSKLQKLVMFILILWGLYKSTFKNNINIQTCYPKYAYFLIIIGICISTFMAAVFHDDQSPLISFQASLTYLLPYLLFYILMKFQVPVEQVEKFLIFMGIVGICVNFLNMLTAPHYLFGISKENADLSRGVVRVRTTIIYICFLFFYSIPKYQQLRSKKWLFLLILSYLFIILWVARQYILFATILGFFLYMKRLTFMKKIIFGIALCGASYVVVNEVPIISNLIQESYEQKEKNDEGDGDIRVQAYDFYCNEYQTNTVTRFLGNGIPSIGNSLWGDSYETIIRYRGTLAADIGWGGFYFYFGVFATLGLAIMFIKSIYINKKDRFKYLNYLLCLYFLTSFAGDTIISMEGITALMIFMYIIWAPNSSCLIRK